MKENNNRSFWQRFAFIYTLFMRQNRKAYATLCRILSEQTEKNHHVLELACGTGQITFPMAGKAAAWTATDFSENMIRKASARNNPPAKGLSFQVADATRLPYADHSFDTVVIANALHIMPEPEKALSEIRRVLKEGGLLFAPTFVYKNQQHKTGFAIRLAEKFGFVTYHKWTEPEYVAFMQNHGFPDAQGCVISARPTQECLITARKNASA